MCPYSPLTPFKKWGERRKDFLLRKVCLIKHIKHFSLSKGELRGIMHFPLF
ncbi:MAG: hypothetical protein JETT_3575 [Candidatus Jettenia ecosi]|uniref:Uncharacterized protein n=1 Tax=Candidatus Jettenia ecosi TaxID=2494326 RepID=A0A533QHX4_9BACT|nr:MAG: hypothetical protein JETT_3575 [Candidatus Jettenia ecosi]